MRLELVTFRGCAWSWRVRNYERLNRGYDCGASGVLIYQRRSRESIRGPEHMGGHRVAAGYAVLGRVVLLTGNRPGGVY